MKSNKIEAKDGDQLLLTSTFWGLYGFTLLLILLVVNGFIQNVYFAGFMLFYAIAMGISVFFPGVHQKIEKKDNINQ